jgi:protein-L-isoaspartate O-methyltransferase
MSEDLTLSTPPEETTEPDYIGTATYSPEDNKIRLYPLHRLPQDIYQRVKAAGFAWAPKQELFVAPMWTPYREDLARELFGQIDDEDTSLTDRAEAKAERLENLSERKLEQAHQARAAVDRIADGIPFGQPILVGHHSEKRARKDAERIQNGMRKAIDCWKAAGYWTDRANSAIRHAKFKERPDVRARRIKTIEAEYRKVDRALIEGRRQLKAWDFEPLTWAYVKRLTNDYRMGGSYCFPLSEYPRPEGASKYEGAMGLWSALGDSPEVGIITPEQARELGRRSARGQVATAERWIEHLENRLAYERAMLDEGGGLIAEKHNLQVGGRVLIGQEWLTILKVNKKDGKQVSVSTSRRYVPVCGVEEIQGYEAPTEEHAAKVAAAVKRPPLCNYPGERFATCTETEWKAIDGDHKSQSHRISETETTGAHCVRYAIGYRLHLPERAGKELESHYCSANRTHTYWPVFITDAKRKDPPAKKPAGLPETLDGLTAEMFNFNPDSGKIRAGIRWTSRQDGPGGECYQFDTFDDVRAHAQAYIDNQDVTAFTLHTYSDYEYKGMKTVFKWEQTALDLFAVKIDDERMTARLDKVIAQNTARAERDAAAAPFEALEQQLKTGVKVVVAPQLFPTPPELAARMAQEAGIEAGQRILEPSAGTGNILTAILSIDPDPLPPPAISGSVTAVEINRALADRLTAEYPLTFVHCGDFLEQNGNLGKFDRIVMNPPFINGADIKHIQHARGFLKPGGRLVALCANGSRQREILKPLAENSGGWWEDLPAGTFKEQGTGVNVALLVIEG